MTQHFHSGYTSKKKKRKKERKTLTRKTTLTPGLIAALFTNAKIGKLCKHSSTKKVFIYIYTHTYTHTHTYKMKYYSAIQRNKTLPFAAT